MKNLLFIISGFILLSSCINSDSKQKSSDSKDRSTKVESPCSLITEAEIKEILSLPQDAPTKMEDVAYTFPTCSYEWETLTYEKQTTIGDREMTIEYPYKLMIVMVANADESMYEKSIVAYKDGEKLTGLGKAATWANSMSQVTFLSDGKMIHLNLEVSTNSNENKDKAIKLARLIEERL